MSTILRSATFDRWLRRLRDRRAVNRIIARLLADEDGHLGGVRPAGEGVSEMRIQHGLGYRIYFLSRGTELIVLLCGGDKDSQRRDIEQAKNMATEWRSNGCGIPEVRPGGLR
ncbi:MAG: type II toxin-antitoxin system RelE/ParE family toxin [bacterium]|nr:type II toxin-antitoxin system RelE/ParE family toxin [bacterium]